MKLSGQAPRHRGLEGNFFRMPPQRRAERRAELIAAGLPASMVAALTREDGRIVRLAACKARNQQ